MKHDQDIQHTILLIDDDANILASLKRLFRNEPYTVLVAGDGVEALQILNSCEVDLAICDQSMPGPSGTEVLSVIKKHWPETMRIMLTGNADVNTLVKAINDGEAYRFLMKPWNDGELLLTVKQALEKATMRQQIENLAREMKRYQETISSLEARYPGITSRNIDEEGNYIVG
jgi:DNA-binding NtrC family response regulator